MNQVTLFGNVGSDPEVHTLNNGESIVKFSLATTEKWKNKLSGEMESKTEWHRLVCFGAKAKVLSDYVKKGNQLLVLGSIQYGSYDNKDGIKVYTTDIRVNNFSLVSNKASTPQAASLVTPVASDLPF